MTIDRAPESGRDNPDHERTPESAPHLGDTSDNDLVARTRAGDRAAYGELWKRHAQAGRLMTMAMTSLDADDLVAEAFTKIYAAIQSGGGPKTGFRSYLFATIRNTASHWGRANREISREDVDVLGEVESSEDQALRNLDRELSAQAFSTLPQRWQEALWYSEVECLSHEEIARILGIKTNAVAVLTYRAREGMRRAWINAYITSSSTDPDCQWTIQRLAGYARKSTTARETKRIDEHLAQCERCSLIAAEANDLGQWLPRIILGPIVGGTAAAIYGASAREGAVGTYAMAAGPMPDSVAAPPADVPARAGRSQAAREYSRRSISSVAGVVGVVAVVGVVTGVVLANLPEPSARSTAIASPSRLAPQSQPFSASLSTGAGDLFLPSARGTGEPGTIITAGQGETELATTKIGRSGSWSIPQLDAAASGTITVNASDSAGISLESVALDYALVLPEIDLTVEGDRLNIVVAGLPDAPIQILLNPDDGEDASPLVAQRLDGAGAGAWTFALPDSPDATIGVRYAAGDRFGVLVTE